MARSASPRARRLALAGGIAATLLLTACAGSPGTDPAPAGSSGTSATSGGGAVSVVASTDVWGSVAQAVGGDAVEVTSLINDPSQDPHSFEASTRDQLLVQDAALVVKNGGGYDPFMDQLLSASGSTAPVVDAVETSGLEGSEGATEAHADEHADEHGDEHGDEAGHDHGEFNEHVWYDLDTAGKVAEAIAEQLSQVAPDDAATFTANAKAFTDGLAAVQQVEASVKDSSTGTGVAITEPVPDYMLEAMGLEVKTPEAFSEAVEEGTDVSPAVLADTTALFSTGAVKALVYNEQTTGSETEAVLAAAKAAGVAVVPVTETLPDGQDYTQWMSANAEAVRAAVQG